MSTAALILAAGEGTRMKSSLPKVAHRVLGVPMIQLVLDSAREAGADPVVVVTGHGADVVEGLVGACACVRQERQLGTGHAVLCARDALADFDGSLLVLSGDTPLMRPETLRDLVRAREEAGAAVSVLTARTPDPSLGRIVRAADGSVAAIVEMKDATDEQRAIDEVNTGTYCFDARHLFAHLDKVGSSNAQGEFYLTDMIAILRSEGLGVMASVTDDAEEGMGVNTRVHLAAAARALQARVNRAHMLAGVTMIDPALVWVAPSVTLGRDVILEPMTFLSGDTSVGDAAHIGPSTRIDGSRIGTGARIDSSVLCGVHVQDGATIGPFESLPPKTGISGERSEEV